MRCLWFVAACLAITGSTWGQDPTPAKSAAVDPTPADPAPSLMITIPDEPKSIDPATVMAPALSKKVTRVFARTSLKELAAWAKSELQMPVILDSKALADLKLLSSEQINDELRDEPVFVILDRLSLLGLGWYVDDGTLRITSLNRANEHFTTRQYVVSDLLDAKYDNSSLIAVIQDCTSGPWDADEPGSGTIVMLGDVLFVRQIDSMHREVECLLNGLRNHGRRTLLMDLPTHAALRARLDQIVTLEFDETPFDEVIGQLGVAAEVKMRIHPSVVSDGVRVRQPLTLKIEGQRLGTAIQEVGSRLGVELRGFVHLGGLWVATKQTLETSYSTAVFDVRDLCRDESEVAALDNAIQDQTGGPWDADVPGTGTLSFPVPGTLVCRQNPPQLDEVLKLLEDYRTALRASKPRPRADEEAEKKKIATYYYRMPTEMANDLARLIPQLVAPESWLGEKPLGSIRQVASQSETENIAPSLLEGGGKGATAPVQTVRSPRSVLIIRQTNATHREIQTLIFNIQRGLNPPSMETSGGMGGMGGGMGGFGGGFFRVEAKTSPAQE